MRKMLLAAAAATTVAFAAAPATAAEFTINPDGSVTGFVGKGEVQSPAGLNNAQMQAVHKAVTFNYEIDETVTYVCTWVTGGGKTQVKNRSRSGLLTAAIQSDSRVRTNNFVGWILSGNLTETGDSDLDDIQDGKSCNGDPDNSGGGFGVSGVISGTVRTTSGSGLTATVPSGPGAGTYALTITNL